MAKNKLSKINVPELFYQVFLKDRTAPVAGSILTVLASTTPSSRGRGLTRVIENLTQEQWDELYGYAAEARAAVIGAGDATIRRASICGKSLAGRMETLGVTNPVTYTPSRTYTRRKAEDVSTPVVDSSNEDSDEDEEDTTLNSVIPATPATLSVVEDVPEVSDDELDGFNEDLSYGS